MNAITHIADEASFDSIATTKGRVLLDFTAERCAPCRALLPIVARVAASSPELRVISIDADAAPEIAVRFGVRGLPTLVVLDGGREVARHLGSTSELRVRALVTEIADEAVASRL